MTIKPIKVIEEIQIDHEKMETIYFSMPNKEDDDLSQ